MAVSLVSQNPPDGSLGVNPMQPMQIVVETNTGTMRTDRSSVALNDFSYVVEDGVPAANNPAGVAWQVSQVLSLGDTRLTFEFMPVGGWQPGSSYGAGPGVPLFYLLFYFFRDTSGAFLNTYDTMQFATAASASDPLAVSVSVNPSRFRAEG